MKGLSSDQRGRLNALLIPLILAVLLFIGAGVFGYWAFSGRQDYKNNVDQKINAAVASAKLQQTATDNKAFAQAEKQPLTTYNGPEAYGSLIVKYPKTWSAYVDSSGQGSALVDAYFDPGTVPSITAQSSSFALRIQVLPQSYTSELSQLSSLQQSGTLTTAAYSLPKVPSVVGIMAVGKLPNQKSGTMVVLPLRSQTLLIWTESATYLPDFDNSVLPNLTFSP